MKYFLFFLLPFLLFSCVSQKVAYNTDDIVPPPNARAIPISVNVKIFDDTRVTNAKNRFTFLNPREIDINGVNSCVNSEEHYNRDSIPTQFTRMFVEHCNAQALFKQTFLEECPNCDYYITGTLQCLYGEQEFSTAKSVGSNFGLLGALATSGITTPARIRIELNHLKLFKKSGELVKEFDFYGRSYNQRMDVDAYCWCIYYHVNESLKEFNTEIIEKIRMELKDMKLD